MEVYDIAVIGAGSAGCVLAARLAAQTDLRIALVEAGPDYGSLASGSWPQDLVDAHHTPDSHDWSFDQSRAHVVGGCSAHNECALVRALPGDYDRWAIPGWTDSELASAIDYVARTLPTTICSDDELATWQRTFLDTTLGAGFHRLTMRTMLLPVLGHSLRTSKTDSDGTQHLHSLTLSGHGSP
jgi:choline dehydrogenase